LKRAASQPDEWLTYGRDYAETHYSPLKQIDDKNVSRLGLAWSCETQTQGAFEDTPLVANGVVYGTGSWSIVCAVDTRTGKKKWNWDPDVDRNFGSHACCGPNNRGVAIYDGKVFVGVLDGRLAALDQETGKQIWSVKTTEDDYQSITGAPRVVKGKVIIGQRRRGVWCVRLRLGVRCQHGQARLAVLRHPRRSIQAGGKSGAHKGADHLEWRVVEDRRRRHGVGHVPIRS